MKKNLKSRKLFLSLLPLAAAVVATPIALTSCKSTQYVGAKTYEASQQYNGIWPEQEKTRNNNKHTTLEILDPNINGDAQNKAKISFKKGLSKNKLQQDFDRVLRKFYQAYEYESDSISNSGTNKDKGGIEAEIKRIKVDSFNKNTLTANLTVTYEVDYDTRSKDDKETIDYQPKKLQIKPHFATFAEIDNITSMLQNIKNDDQEGDNFSIDVEDLLELYVGDKDDNEKSIFEQVEHITKDSSKYGGLLGYSINVQDLAYTPETSYKLKTTDLTKQNLFAPSSVIQEFYVPQVDEVISKHKLDFTISYEKVSKYTLSQLKSIKSLNGDDQTSSGTKTNNNTSSIGLNDILENKIEKVAEGMEISVLVQEIQNGSGQQNIPVEQIGNLAVLITIKENKDQADLSRIVLTIDKDWAKPETNQSGNGK